MPRIAYVILYSCLIVFAGLIASPANAGDRDDGYYSNVNNHPHRASRVQYSSSCCYRKIVRHARQERYVEMKPPRKKKAWRKPYRQYRDDGYDDGPDDRVSHYDAPRRYVEYDDDAVRPDRCRHRRVRVLSGDGGWVWALTASCY